MKHSFVLCFVAAVILTGCSTSNHSLNKEPVIGMANPASVFCVNQGGKSEIRKNTDGSEYGVCIFPNGQIVEEWAYFRQHNK